VTFEVSGKLILNALVMYDRQTDSLWSQFLGQAVHGELDGTKLELLPSQLISLGAWKEAHPETLVLEQDGTAYDSYLRYYFNESAGVYGQINPDNRLLPKELVLGVLGNDAQKAYPFATLMENPVANDGFDRQDLVVVLDRQSGATNVFDRRLDARTLTFEEAQLPLYFTDRETGSTWNKETGMAVS